MLKLATKFAPTEAAFAQAAEAGFRCAEIWTDPDVLADWRTVAERARRVPLEYVIHLPNRTDLSDATLAQVVELYRALGCRAAVVHEPVMSRHGPRLRELGPELRLGVENHAMVGEAFEAWAERHEWLTLDVEHLWKFTLRDAPQGVLLDTLHAFLARRIGKLAHLHLPGYLPGQVEHRPMYCSRDLVRGVWDLLAELDYRGFVVSEVARPFQNPYDLRMDRLLFEGWLAESGA